jgi:hypothetical protein
MIDDKVKNLNKALIELDEDFRKNIIQNNFEETEKAIELINFRLLKDLHDCIISYNCFKCTKEKLKKLEKAGFVKR